jgi:predicted small lipoprotein YifL
MKKTMLMLVMVGVALTACDKKEDSGFQWRPDVLFPIQGIDLPTQVATARGTLKYANGQQQRMTAKEVTKRYLEIYPDVAWHTTNDEGSKGFLYVPPEYVDTANARFMMASGYIIWEDGSIGKDFIYNYDNYFVDCHTGDTIAYIPNSAIESARERILALHAEGRYDEIYELFQDAFVFYPCTGQEYKDIVANGGN